jgi:glycosyltransferase involved in cell wall biosynthesis
MSPSPTRSSAPNDRITVAIPTRDRPGLLKRTVASVLAQTRPADRVHVVDNSVTMAEATETVCREFSNHTLHYLAPVRGLSFNENHQRALSTIDTTFGCILQDDDLYTPTFLEVGERNLRDNPSAVLFAVNYSAIDADDAVTQDHTWPRFPAGTLTSRDFLRFSMEEMSPVHLSASMFRSTATVGLSFQEVDRGCSDMGLFFRIAAAGDVILLKDALSQIRIHGSGASVSAGWFANHLVTGKSLEWDVKSRFLHSDGARQVFGEELDDVIRSASRKLAKAYAGALRDRSLTMSQRVGLMKSLSRVVLSAR